MFVSVCACMSVSICQVGYQTPPLWGHLRPSKVWRPISPHHFPCRWQTPSDIGALVVLCVRGWAPRYPPAHSLAAAYRGLEPGARSGHFGDGVPSASRPGARSLRHSWLPAELTGTSLQPPLASAPRLLSDPSSGTLLSSFWDSGAAAPLLVFLGLLCSGGLWMSGVLISSIPASCPGGRGSGPPHPLADHYMKEPFKNKRVHAHRCTHG